MDDSFITKEIKTYENGVMDFGRKMNTNYLVFFVGEHKLVAILTQINFNFQEELSHVTSLFVIHLERAQSCGKKLYNLALKVPNLLPTYAVSFPSLIPHTNPVQVNTAKLTNFS